MVHFYDAVLQRPDRFNFAVDVVDYWAARPDDLEAMYWVSKDASQKRSLTFKYFSRQSHRVSVLLQRLGVKEGETMVMIVPRVPASMIFSIAASKAKPACGASVAKFLAVRDACPSVRTASLELLEADASVEDVRQDWNSPALLYFTSGTSGPPKMVRHNQVSYPLALTTTAKSWYQLAPGKVLWNTAEQGGAKLPGHSLVHGIAELLFLFTMIASHSTLSAF
ncbi:hypothetical protein VC83_08830 [Pseudogymnoascus destructans]|uniref:AMP-dependent synthetase/ligase domain-containing protein n=1 Tax=Pseudogymnoascus destructans TaxID=655981 RepID=A0A176ZXG4_9PEZI|nr:uncharacterized protein VC83_08830 [Pseudogymnoascus destructans]OAF54685.1 hypothetical protein VC83_08830 [Pseudogymnoascus destructans]